MLCLCYDEQDAGLIAERNQSEYEKNKAKARKANIQFPTPFPTGLMKQSLVWVQICKIMKQSLV